MNTREKILASIKQINDRIIDREDDVNTLVHCLLTNQHAFFCGEPGTAKSFLANAVASMVDGAKKFFLQFSKDTRVEELVGPIMVTELMKDRFTRRPTGRLPEAHVAILDELDKASSASANVMLGILNERLWSNDGNTVKCPLRFALGTSNAWLEREESWALLDRFLFRRIVNPITSDRSIVKLLRMNDVPIQITHTITIAELDEAVDEVAAIPISNEAMDATIEIMRELRKEKISPTNRRTSRCMIGPRASAWLDGATEVRPQHLDILKDILWDSPESQQEKVETIIVQISNPSGMKINSLRQEIDAILAGINPGNVSDMGAASGKLKEIARQLRQINHPKAIAQVDRINSEMEELRKACVSATSF